MPPIAHPRSIRGSVRPAVLCSAMRIAARLGAVLLLGSAVATAEESQSGVSSSPAQPAAMTIWQARRIVAMGNPAWSLDAVRVDRRSFRFTADGFAFEASRRAVSDEHFDVDLRKLDEVAIECRAPWQNDNSWCRLTDARGKALRKNGSGGLWFLYYERWHDRDDASHCSARCVSAAHAFAAAVNRMRAFASDAESPLRTFAQRAAAWRALPSKPPVPEEVRLQRLLAEDAIKQSKPGEALHRYETGLELHPTWPQGWFNAALVAGELGLYVDAVEHMQAYLELVPDAPDAQAARDQIAVWQFKADEAR